jgi:hypothetical protein
MTFLTATGYDTAAIMRDAHRRAKKMRATPQWQDAGYWVVFSFYLGQVWVLAQHAHRARLCGGNVVVLAKAFDNNNSPLWRL